MHGLEVLVALCRSSAFYRVDLNSSNAGTRPISGGIRLGSRTSISSSSHVPDDVAVADAVAGAGAGAVAVRCCRPIM
ncbi:predicted protein [Botrytis cinerea T4]|uniref:Uncharacterized protein n=1 Tax=Botryotinia fuckeliana (strain T4) TaxID=999810 RepID=G2XPZ6_BOTF4|nr:predicted protein [Botrytis cinerea T4]